MKNIGPGLEMFMFDLAMSEQNGQPDNTHHVP